jgi:prepilin-type N-terminal cleavage/methylation domain-containing protein
LIVRSGFTLIELIIVVVLVGILAAIAIPNYNQVVNRAKDASVRTNMYMLQSAVEEFAVRSNGGYPGSPTAVTPAGDSLRSFCPQGQWPINPYTRAREVPVAGVLGNAPTNPSPGRLYYFDDGANASTPSANRYAVYGVKYGNALLDSLKN